MKEKIQNGWLFLKRYWGRPQKGDMVAYKEIAAFSVGGMGVKAFGSFITQIQFSATCLLMSICYKLTPNQILYLFLLTNIINIIKTPFISMIVDNTNTPVGKFRPYLIWAGIPSLIAIIGCTWLVPHPEVWAWIGPKGEEVYTFICEGWMEQFIYNINGIPWGTIVMIAIFTNLLNIFQPLLNNSYMGISQVITPNSGERSKILGISEFLANLGPSIIQFLLPLLGGMCFGADKALSNVWTYRIFMPILGVFGLLLAMLVLYFTQERVIMPKVKKNKIGFFKGISLLCHSKEFWLVTISKFFDGFKGVLTLMLVWICRYALKNEAFLGVAQTITSIGFTPGIILAPILIWKLGTRGAGCFAHFLNVVMALLMLATFKYSPWVYIIALLLYNFAMGPQYIIQTTIMSDSLDDIQNKTGVRVEGFAQNFQLMVTTAGNIVSTILFTSIYNKFIPTDSTGVANYDALIDIEGRLYPLVTQIIILVIGASLLSAIPYVFVTLNKKKMTIIKESLERKKVIADAGLEHATLEEQDAAYAAYLAEKAANEQKAKDLDAKEKAALEEKQRAEKEAIEAWGKELEDIRLAVLAKGGSEADADKAISEKEQERALAQKTQRQEAFAKLKEDQKTLSARRKTYVAEWKTNALAIYAQNKADAKQETADAKAKYVTQMQEYNNSLAGKKVEAIQLYNTKFAEFNQAKPKRIADINADYYAKLTEFFKYKEQRFAEINANFNSQMTEYKNTKAHRIASVTAKFFADLSEFYTSKEQKVAEINANFDSQMAELDKLASECAESKFMTSKIEKDKKAVEKAKNKALAKLTAEEKALIKEKQKALAQIVAEEKAIKTEKSKDLLQLKADEQAIHDGYKIAISELNAEEKAIKAIKNSPAQEKKDIKANRKEVISDAKLKSKNIKIWLNVLAREAFSRLLAEEALTSASDDASNSVDNNDLVQAAASEIPTDNAI